MALALKFSALQWRTIYCNILSKPDLHVLKIILKMLRWYQNMKLSWKSCVLPIFVAWQWKSWWLAAVLQLLGLDHCASRAFSQEPDKSLSLITNDNLTGATMHVTFNQFAICIHYVHLLFWVMKNWRAPWITNEVRRGKVLLIGQLCLSVHLKYLRQGMRKANSMPSK